MSVVIKEVSVVVLEGPSVLGECVLDGACVLLPKDGGSVLE